MNIELSSVSQMGDGPGSCGTSKVCPSMMTGSGSTRSTPVVISTGTAA